MTFKDTVNLYRRYPYWAAKRCIFVHVPKAAGTSINRALYGRTLGHYRAADIHRRFPVLYERSFVFAFVRNPWDRVLSAYRFAVKGRTEYMGMRSPARYRIAEFETFERFLCEWLAPRDLPQLDYVFQPQYPFVTDDEGERIVDFIGKVEEIGDHLKIVEKRLGRALELPHVNRTGDSAGYVTAYRNSRMIDLVADVYAKDISMFNYEF